MANRRGDLRETVKCEALMATPHYRSLLMANPLQLRYFEEAAAGVISVVLLTSVGFGKAKPPASPPQKIAGVDKI